MNLTKKISIKILRVLEILEDLYTNLLIGNVELSPISRIGAIMDLKSIKLYKSWANKYIYVVSPILFVLLLCNIPCSSNKKN